MEPDHEMNGRSISSMNNECIFNLMAALTQNLWKGKLKLEKKLKEERGGGK